jgi:hypothetical protein
VLLLKSLSTCHIYRTTKIALIKFHIEEFAKKLSIHLNFYLDLKIFMITYTTAPITSLDYHNK